jgi:hypothetical protein
MNMNDEHECGRMERKRSTKKRWIDSVKQDMREMAVRTCCADPK